MTLAWRTVPRDEGFDLAGEIVRARTILKERPHCGHSLKHDARLCPNVATHVIVVMCRPVLSGPYVLIGGVCDSCRKCAVTDGDQWPFPVLVHTEPLVLS